VTPAWSDDIHVTNPFALPGTSGRMVPFSYRVHTNRHSLPVRPGRLSSSSVIMRPSLLLDSSSVKELCAGGRRSRAQITGTFATIARRARSTIEREKVGLEVRGRVL
jgi:hypothetical protein